MTEPVVTIKQGKIRGTTGTDLDGGQFFKFLGIPYAKPPIGPLRFKAPQPAESWDDVRDCTREGSSSLFYETMTQQILGSEDCLYLNLFTKQLPSSGSTLKPVMVFIHGGGFTLGSGSELLQGPKHLLTEDIVFVEFNYRLGIFGFLSSDDLSLDVPGNAGLKDQTLALKWVQENIASFNGDPNNVTIFGVSAGGASVHFQVLSPTAKGLFHKAIAQSGTTLMPWAWGQKNAILVAEKLGKKVATEKEALDVLMEVPAKELISAAIQFRDFASTVGVRRPFAPVIEKPNPTAFLTENPLELLAFGRYNQVPIIIGITSNEGTISETTAFGPYVPVTPESGINWSLGIEQGTEKYKQLAKRIEDFYFSEGMSKDASYKLVGDAAFVLGAIVTTRLAVLPVNISTHPVYAYVYARESGLSDIMKKRIGIHDDKIRGVSHGGDQTVLFDSILMKMFSVEMTEDNIDAAKQLVKLWTNFARSGKPHENWEPVTDPDNIKYFEIDKDVSLKTNPFADRVAFWDKELKIAESGVKFDPTLHEKIKQL